MVITWPTTASGFVLESTDSLSAINWTTVVAAIAEEGAFKKVEVLAAGAAKFYRLRN